MKGSKLSIGPPILLGGKGVDKVGGTGREGALRKFRGNYRHWLDVEFLAL